MLAGFSEIEFTPKSGNSPGGFLPAHKEGTDLGLFSNVAAFTSGAESVILISMDVLSFHAEYSGDMRRRISEATGVPVKNILIAATHTHSSTSTEYQLWMCPPDVELTSRIADLTVEAAIRAWNNRSEAKLGVGTTYNAKYNFCRDFYMKDGSVEFNPGYDREDLVRPIGTPDHSVNVMRVDGTDGKPRCFIVNYANHPCCFEYRPEYKDVFSADFPGYLRASLKKEYGEDVTVLFFTGPAGDVNCVDFQYGTTKIYKEQNLSARKIIGEALAEDVIELDPRIFSIFDEPLIQAKSEMHTTTRRKRSEEDHRWGLEMLEKAKTEKISSRKLAFATEYAEPDDPNEPDTVELEIHTIQIGPWAIVGLPGEIYSEIGKRIKAVSPYPHTIIVELANATNGYISPDHIVTSETYEAKISKYNAFTGLGTADVLVNGSLKMLGEMIEKDNEKNFVNK